MICPPVHRPVAILSPPVRAKTGERERSRAGQMESGAGCAGAAAHCDLAVQWHLGPSGHVLS